MIRRRIQLYEEEGVRRARLVWYKRLTDDDSNVSETIVREYDFSAAELQQQIDFHTNRAAKMTTVQTIVANMIANNETERDEAD